MQIQELKPIHKLKRKKRVGRGGKKGTYCGRGVKGQKSRAGRKLKPIIREIIKKYPKLRGYRFKPRKKDFVILNLKDLDKIFNENEIVSPKTLIEKGIIKKGMRKIPEVKILAEGEITKALTFKGFRFSSSAKTKIEKAGGKIKEEKNVV